MSFKPRYPYFNMPFEGREIRPHTWVFLNRPTFYLNKGESWKIPNHYVTDGYSIPRPWRWFVQKGKPNKLAPGFHDYFCDYGSDGRIDMPDKYAHELFEVMLTAWIWLKEEDRFVRIVPGFDWGMAKSVKLFGPRWK